ncbi:hypothetical protein MMC07_001010 [Pseudocyphellaria aurata]|nr:hypothetical protein [Pseudocyphellaria aurata]
MKKSNLDLARECDSFPYYEDNPDEYSRLIASYYKFLLQSESETRGWIPNWVVEQMPWTSDWTIDHEKRIVSPKVPIDSNCTSDELHRRQSIVIAETLQLARERNVFAVLSGWRNELYPVNTSSQIPTSIERAGSSLFGIVTYGVHMTAYVKYQNGIKIWVPRRAKTKQTFGGMLDNTVAGGISTGENPFESLVREAAEEASIPESIIRSRAKSCGMVTYIYIRDQRAGGESGLLQPEVEYVYDLELDPSVVPLPADGEVEEFYLWTIEEVQKALAEGQFKPNCAIVLLDFFVRHGILTFDNEKHLIEIVSRIHRKLPFPTD